MAITVEQTWDGSQISGQMDDGSITSEYLVRGTSDEFAAWTALEAATALIVGSLVKQDVNIDRRLGEFEWAGSVKWGMRERPETNDSSFSFDTSGGNQHITQALQTAGTYAAPGVTAPNYQGAIGVSDNGVEGVDVTVPVYNFEETHYLPIAFVDATYKLLVFTPDRKGQQPGPSRDSQPGSACFSARPARCGNTISGRSPTSSLPPRTCRASPSAAALPGSPKPAGTICGSATRTPRTRRRKSWSAGRKQSTWNRSMNGPI